MSEAKSLIWTRLNQTQRNNLHDRSILHLVCMMAFDGWLRNADKGSSARGQERSKSWTFNEIRASRVNNARSRLASDQIFTPEKCRRAPDCPGVPEFHTLHRDDGHTHFACRRSCPDSPRAQGIAGKTGFPN